MLVTTTTSEHIGLWIKMRRPLARFSGLESSFHARYSADFIIITSGFRFSIHPGWEQAPRYLIRDRDGVYGEVFIRRLRSMGIRARPTSPHSPWQNGYAERLIGSIRRECLDHVVLFGERHLRHVLLSYMKYHNEITRQARSYWDASRGKSAFEPNATPGRASS